MFKISVKGAKFDSSRRLSNTEYLVSGAKMTPQIQRILSIMQAEKLSASPKLLKTSGD